MPSWVISSSCTQCGQPHSTWPSRSSAMSSCVGLGSSDHVALGDELLAGAQPGHQRRSCVVGDAEPLAVAAARGRSSRAGPASIRSECSGCNGSRNSFSLREVPHTPRLSCSISAPILSAKRNRYLTTMPRHPGQRLPALPGPGRLLPRAQAAPMSIPIARPGPPDAVRLRLAWSSPTPFGRSHGADSASRARQHEGARQAPPSCTA